MLYKHLREKDLHTLAVIHTATNELDSKSKLNQSIPIKGRDIIPDFLPLEDENLTLSHAYTYP